MRVFVYWNLHKHCWSLKALEGEHKGRVVAHCYHRLSLHDCEFKVSEAGRQRVLAERRKNVHAGVAGNLYQIQGEKMLRNLSSTDIIDLDYKELDELHMYRRVRYNPYYNEAFVFDVDGGEEPVYKADEVDMSCREKKVMFANGIHYQ